MVGQPGNQIAETIMEYPFCDNKECDLNKVKVVKNIGSILITKEHDKKRIFRHVYRNPSNEGNSILHLCGVCHNAVQIVK